jgi:hypothetical protein
MTSALWVDREVDRGRSGRLHTREFRGESARSELMSCGHSAANGVAAVLVDATRPRRGIHETPDQLSQLAHVSANCSRVCVW